ncbi:nucleotidyltransferase family protein [Bordetella sp. H567]|uniref:nucleotidyltransferase family protein n=1 Tax=Bordetella sp. H567 TaxID=1697043 RepID=UPI001F15DA2C|nr:nucleotidyltransferase family protein [Bordetella sp. H567]
MGILLAAGRGERFRASAGHAEADKLLSVLPDGRTVAQASAGALRQALPAVIAVVRAGTPVLRQVLESSGCVLLETADAARGMGASLACAAREVMRAWDGARWTPGGVAMPPPRGCLVALADMPWVTQETLRAVQEAARTRRIAAPVHDGRRGHPVAFAWDLLPELAALDGDEGARALLKRHGVYELPCADPGVLRDIDTVQDLP